VNISGNSESQLRNTQKTPKKNQCNNPNNNKQTNKQTKKNIHTREELPNAAAELNIKEVYVAYHAGTQSICK
jgi:hypothetical protein